MPRLSKPASNVLTLGEAQLMFERSLRAANKSEKTITTYTHAVRKLIEHVGDRPIDSITRADHERLVGELQTQGWKASSISTVYRSLRSFWKWAVEHDDVPVARDPMNGMRPPVVPVEPPAYPTPEEVRQVLSTCQSRSRHNFLGIRDEAIIRIFATTGARLSEVAELRVQDVDLDTAYPQITVLGKGRRTRDLPLDERTADALRRYLKRERPRHPSAATEWLWLARAGRMTASGIAQMTTERGKAVGVELHAHAFRHYAIDQMLRSGMSEGDTMAVSGHRSRSMMDRYAAARRAERAHQAFRQAGRASL